MKPPPSQDRRGNDRRRGERRQFFRLVYPSTLVPKTLSSNLRVINLSQQGILLTWEGKPDECPVKLTLGSVLNLEIQFHDGETFDLGVRITRCHSERHSHRVVYAGTLKPALSAARISKEEAHLLRQVPDFCRVEWYSADPLVDD